MHTAVSAAGRLSIWPMRIVAVICLAWLAAGAMARGSSASAQSDDQAWPQRTVRIIVPFGPGSASDISARLLAERLQKAWDRAVIVENKPGGDGLVSISAFVSAHDDHTMFLSPSTTFLVHPYAQDNLPYEFERDFKPITWVSSTSIGIAVTATLPVATLPEFVAYAKREAGKVNYGISGGFLEFAWDGFRRERNVPMVKVPFRDIVQAPIDLAEGRIAVLMTSVTTHGPMLRAGKTKLLAICDSDRSDLVPGVPTVIEAGYPELRLDSLNVLFGPGHMSDALRDRISSAAAAALKEPEVMEKLRISGQMPSGAGPQKVASILAGQQEQVARIAKVLGIARKK